MSDRLSCWRGSRSRSVKRSRAAINSRNCRERDVDRHARPALPPVRVNVRRRRAPASDPANHRLGTCLGRYVVVVARGSFRPRTDRTSHVVASRFIIVERRSPALSGRSSRSAGRPGAPSLSTPPRAGHRGRRRVVDNARRRRSFGGLPDRAKLLPASESAHRHLASGSRRCRDFIAIARQLHCSNDFLPGLCYGNVSVSLSQPVLYRNG